MVTATESIDVQRLRGLAVDAPIELVPCSYWNCRGWDTRHPSRICVNELCRLRTIHVGKLTIETFDRSLLETFTEAELRGLYVYGTDDARAFLVQYFPADVADIVLFHTTNTEVLSAAWRVLVRNRTDWDDSGSAIETATMLASADLFTNAARSGLDLRSPGTLTGHYLNSPLRRGHCLSLVKE